MPDDLPELSLIVRAELDLSQSDLARLLGVHQPDISKLETDRKPLADMRAKRLAALAAEAKRLRGVYRMLVVESYEHRVSFDPSLKE